MTHEVLADVTAEDEQRNGRLEERLEEALVPETTGTAHSVVLDWTSVSFVDSVGAKAVKQVLTPPSGSLSAMRARDILGVMLNWALFLPLQLIKEFAAVDVNVVIAGCNSE